MASLFHLILCAASECTVDPIRVHAQIFIVTIIASCEGHPEDRQIAINPRVKMNKEYYLLLLHAGCSLL
jgi:hypothetical protein